MSRVRIVLAATSGLAAWLPLALVASVSDVVPARTGGFGEMTCQQCHWENPLNDPAGRLELDGVPAAYTPGEQYLITVSLARPGLARAGFQLTVREDGINMNAGNDAGVLRPTDESAHTVQDGPKRVTYLQHTRTGATVPSAGAAKWTFEWTAPDDGAAIFHLTGNAANGDDSPLGDFIYAASKRTTPNSQ